MMLKEGLQALVKVVQLAENINDGFVLKRAVMPALNSSTQTMGKAIKVNQLNRFNKRMYILKALYGWCG